MAAVTRASLPLARAGKAASRWMSSIASTPLTEAPPGLPELKPAGGLPRPVTKVTTLDNGLRVASEEAYGQVSCVTAFVAAGSMYEGAHETGLCQALEHTAFKSTTTSSAAEVWGAATEAGMSLAASNAREVLTYRADCVRDSVPLAVQLLADTLTKAVVSDAEVEVAKQIIEFQHYQMNDMPGQMVHELLHAAAFGPTSALGRPLLPPMSAVPGITPEALREYRATHFTPDRIVIAGAGVDHDTLVAQVQGAFGGLAPSPHHSASGAAPVASAIDGVGGDPARASTSSAWPRPDQSYVGGLVQGGAVKNNQQPLDFSHISIAFPTVGWTDSDVVPLCVLDTLLGGGSSFSAGGPGKGMYSRLYRQVLNTYAWVDAANAFSLQFDHHGLFGLYGSARPADMPFMLGVLLDHLKALRRTPVAPGELSRARNQLTSSVMMNLEMKSIVAEDIGRQVVVLDKRLDPQELVQRIQAVTPEDLKRVATAALQHKPAVAVLGDAPGLLDYDGIVAALADEGGTYSSMFNKFLGSANRR